MRTQSQWGWQSFPNSAGDKLTGSLVDFNVQVSKVPYAGTYSTPAAKRLRGNSHRPDLARIGLNLKKYDGSPAMPEDLSNPKQILDLWTDVLTS